MRFAIPATHAHRSAIRAILVAVILFIATDLPADEVPSTAASRPSTTEQSDWQARFYAHYRLSDDEVLKRIPPPFIPERMQYYWHHDKHQAELIPEGPDYFQFRWDGTLKSWGMGFVNQVRLDRVLGILGLGEDEYEAPKSILDFPISGDWICRDGTSSEQRLKTLETLIEKDFGAKIRFNRKKVTRKVIVARGDYQFHPLSDTKKRRSTELHIFADTFDSDEGAGGGPAKNLPNLLSKIASRLNCPIINEAHAPPDLRVQYAWHYSSSLRRISDPKDKDRVIRQVLANLEKQTSLRFTFEQRPVDIWFIIDEGDRPEAGPRVTEDMWDQAGTSQPATAAP